MRSFIPTRRTALTITCFALAAAVVSGGSALAQAAKDAPPAATEEMPPVKQLALTEKQVQGVISAQKDMDAITVKIPEGAGDKPDPKVQAELEAVAKKNGFASYDEYSDVLDNIGLVMSGIDPKTKQFTQPPEALKAQIAALQADTKMAAKNKQAALAEMNAALKTTPTVQFPANVQLVTKYYDKLSELLQSDE